jgi:biopolymer transport protein ExbB
MNDWHTLVDAARLGGWVIYPLGVLAIAALAITLDRAYVFWRFGRAPRWADGAELSQDGEGARSSRVGKDDEERTEARFSGLPRRHAFSRISALLADSRAPLWWIESRIEAAAAQVEREMSRGLWLLETIVTAAPLLGLFGTIVGMMHSFRLIGGDGLVNPSGVSGGVAQALIATAIGLVIALVALFAFNFYSRRIDRLMDDLESFANASLSDRRLADGNSGRPS